MDHLADVGEVHPHPERRGRHDHLQARRRELLVDILALVAIQRAVVGGGGDAGVAEQRRDLFGGGPAAAVDQDPALAGGEAGP